MLKSEALGSNQTWNGNVVVDTATVHLFGRSTSTGSY